MIAAATIILNVIVYAVVTPIVIGVFRVAVLFWIAGAPIACTVSQVLHASINNRRT
jgi:hypothetical protein